MLRDRAVDAFDRAARVLAAGPGAEPARALLATQRQRLLSTLRVALVGRVSSGKSTLANALLGCYRVATGPEELTYNVNWLRYGEQPGILVHFRDGRPSTRLGLADLEDMTVRAHADPARQEFLSCIDYVEVSDPNPQLRAFDLIDTPGLDSHFRSDSMNTLRFLGRTGDAHGKWLRPLLNADAEAAARTRLDLWDLGHRMRHELSDAEHAADSLTALTPVVQVSRQDLEKWMRPALRHVASACRDLFTQAGPRPGGTASEPVSWETVTAVILAGGGARVPALCEALSGALQRPVRAVPAPELTALRGGIEWARAAAARRVPAIPAPAGLRELAWEIPGGAAHLTRWNAEPGTAFGAHEPLATVRTEDDALWDLSSDRPGILEQRCQPIGAIVASGDVLAISRLTAIGPPDRLDTPGRIGALHGGRFAAFSADGKQAATLDTAGILRIWDVETGGELTSAPVTGRNEPGWLDATTRPGGNWVTAFHDGSAVVVYDVTASRRVSRLVKSSEPVTVQFSSDGMRLRTGERKRATIWDDHWHDVLTVEEKLLGSDAVAMSQDGRLLAVASRAGIEVWQQPIPKRALVRPLPKFKGRVWQIAFTPGAGCCCWPSTWRWSWSNCHPASRCGPSTCPAR